MKMNPPSSLVVLKSTSSMSLHDRFTYMLQNSQPVQMDVNVTIPPLQTPSLQNQRLAQQLANRPSVLAALPNRPNLKQRLGERSIAGRLGRPGGRGRRLHGTPRSWWKPRGRGRLLRDFPQNNLSGLHVSGGPIHQQHGDPGAPEQAVHSRRFLGAVRGKGRGRTPGRPVPTREELDQQLDDYMSMTKSHLDAQLDEYMAEVDSEELL